MHILYHNTYVYRKYAMSFLKVRTKLSAIKTVASLIAFFSPSTSLSSNATLSDEGTWSKYYLCYNKRRHLLVEQRAFIIYTFLKG